MKIYVLRHEKRFSSPSFDTTLKEEGIEDAKKLSLLLRKYIKSPNSHFFKNSR